MGSGAIDVHAKMQNLISTSRLKKKGNGKKGKWKGREIEREGNRKKEEWKEGKMGRRGNGKNRE